MPLCLLVWIISTLCISGCESGLSLQNSAARLLTGTKKDHITPVLISLHWLPIRYRIQYKVLLYVSNISMALHQSMFLIELVYISGSQFQSSCPPPLCIFRMLLLSLQMFVLLERKCPAKWTSQDIPP